MFFYYFLWNFIYIYIKISIGFWLCYVIILENVEENIWNICKIIIKFIRLKASLLFCINLEFLYYLLKSSKIIHIYFCIICNIND
jgi:hypothetical protein